MHTKNNVITAEEVSKCLNIPIRTIYHLSKTGRIKGIKVGKLWRYNKDDIENHLSLGLDFSREAKRKPNEFVEKRVYPRINTNLICNYSVNLPPFKEINGKGIIKNIGVGGVSFFDQTQGPEKTQIDDPIYLSFLLIFDDGNKINMNAKGKIVWQDKNLCGIKFRNINKEKQNEIIEYVS